MRIDGLSEQRGGSLAGRQQPRQHLHRGGLAAAIGAEEAKDFAGFDPKAYMIDRGEPTEALGQPRRLDRRRSGAWYARWDHQRLVSLALGFRQQGDERFLQAGCPGLAEDLRRTAGGDQPAGVHRRQPVELCGLLHVGAGDDYAHAGPANPHAADQFPELPPRQRIDAGRGFVEDQQVGFMDQRAAQRQLLLHPAGKLPRRAVRVRVQPRAHQQIGDARLALSRRLTEQSAKEIKIFHYAQRWIEVPPEPLRHIGDPRPAIAPVPRTAHVPPERHDPAGLAPLHAGKQPQ